MKASNKIGEVSSGAEDTVGSAGVGDVVDAVVARESELITKKGKSAFSAPMGEEMKYLRGKANSAIAARIWKSMYCGVCIARSVARPCASLCSDLG